MSLRPFAWRGGSLLTALVFGTAAHALPQSPATGATIVGPIENLTVDNPNDPFSAGKMQVSGQLVILPRNLVIDLPANRLTVQQLFAQAPPAAFAVQKSGLAIMDGAVGIPGTATIHANRTSFGNVIAGDVFIQKGIDTLGGVVTFINHTDGYLRVDGIIGDDTTGTMVRINDPESVHTIQRGKGCDGGPNCSPDPRFTNDPVNYTIAFTTGYPAGIPSTVPVGQRSGFTGGDNAAAASNASGVGDPFCPSTNRGVNPVPDSRRFAPIRVGDSITCEGNYELVAGQRFLSAHTLTVLAGLTTQDSPNQPDYMTWAEVEWDVAAFGNQRQRLLLIGFTTLPSSQLDVFALHIGTNGVEHEFPLASTVGNPDTINQGIGATAPGIFKIRFDTDFVQGARLGLSPCENLANAGLPSPCTSVPGSVIENLLVTNPISRDLIGRSRHKATLAAGVITRDINGNEAANGEYLTPVGVGFPEFVEIDLNALQTPFSFDAIPWSSDRRLGPGGAGGNQVAPLDPFPWSGVDPLINVPGAARQRIFGFYPFGVNNLQAWPPTPPGAVAIAPLPVPPAPGGAVPAPVANFSANTTGGTVPLVVNFSDASTGNVNARLWDFGDGSFSILQNPSHTYATAGTFSVSLTALGNGGANTNTKAGFVNATQPGGPGAPTANFSQDRTAGNIPLTVNFTNLTTGNATSFLWNFGDGATSTQTSPSHVYTVAGLYTVTLTATGPGGTNAVSRVDAVRANTPGAVDIDFRGQPRTGAAPLVVRFRTQVLSGGGTGITGTWDFGDGSTAPANGQDIFHTYTTPGSYTVTLTGSNGTATDIEQKLNYITVNAGLLVK